MKAVSFTGHRPQKLEGFDWNKPWNNPAVFRIFDQLYPVIEYCIKSGADTFVTGGAIGVDQIAFFTVEKLKKTYPHIKNIVAIPYADQPGVWKSPEIKQWYQQILILADEVIYVDNVEGYMRTNVPVGTHHVDKLQIRNEYMVDVTDTVIAYWDGTTGGTGNCVKYAHEKNRFIYNAYPKEVIQ